MRYFIVILTVFICITACTTQRNFTYFSDLSDTVSYYSIEDTGYKELSIKADDILAINISSPNPEANIFFNTPVSISSITSAGSSTNQPSSYVPNTYLVDKDGNIDLPTVGSIKVAGKTTREAKALITQKVLPYLKDPVVVVRVNNFKITVLGEVSRPANYIVPNERVSVLDALGMAGDLTIFGRRENVLLVREKEGRKILTRLNLNSSALFQSPYYYLQQNDILYVEPNKAKAATNDVAQIRNITIFTSLASLATIIVSRL